MDHVPEVRPALANKLERAEREADIIVRTYPTDEVKNIASSCYQVFKNLVKEIEGAKFENSQRDNHIYEAWRILWFHYKPRASATGTCEVQQLITPPKITDVKHVPLKLGSWERKLAECYDRTGSEVMHDITRRQLMVHMMPDVNKHRLVELLEPNTAITIPTLRQALTNRVRLRLGTAEAEKHQMDLDNLGPEKPADDPNNYWANWDDWGAEAAAAWESGDAEKQIASFGCGPKGASKGKGKKREGDEGKGKGKKCDKGKDNGKKRDGRGRDGRGK